MFFLDIISNLVFNLNRIILYLKLLIINKMGKLNFLGIGPKIASILLPWLTLTIILSSISKGLFKYSSANTKIVLTAGIVLMGCGLIFYSSTVRLLVKGLKETRLITSGPYSFCQNPLYASIVLFIIPALSLILNSWLILTSSLIGYLMFKIFIPHECKELEKFFGVKYTEYKKNTPEFFPVPFRKWHK